MIPRRQVQTALQLIFPPRCIGCGDLVEIDFQLCGRCWSDTPFIRGVICDVCGAPLPGEETGQTEICDDCMRTPRPWEQGRAVLVYEDKARQMVMRLKHGDRHDVVHPAGRWMAKAARVLIQSDTIVCPIPLHWGRFLRRRYNQSALLADAMARQLNLRHIPDLLLRCRATVSMEGMSKAERFANLDDSIIANPKFVDHIQGADILLVDDVMTSGATFAAASEACLATGADQVNVISLARVAKRP
ncbi:MAG: ComF family protein [Cognatishimia sp.]